MLKLKVSTDAVWDLKEAVRYYNTQQVGLGRSFEKAIKQSFDKIQEMPKAASFVFGTIRYKVVDKFPFIIIYEETKAAIIILRFLMNIKVRIS